MGCTISRDIGNEITMQLKYIRQENSLYGQELNQFSHEIESKKKKNY